MTVYVVLDTSDSVPYPFIPEILGVFTDPKGAEKCKREAKTAHDPWHSIRVEPHEVQQPGV